MLLSSCLVFTLFFLTPKISSKLNPGMFLFYVLNFCKAWRAPRKHRYNKMPDVSVLDTCRTQNIYMYVCMYVCMYV